MTQIVCLDRAPADMGDIQWDSVRAHGELTLFEGTEDAQIVERSKGADIVITNKVGFTKETFEQLPNLKLLCVLATGYNHIDLDAAVAHDVTVCNLPGYSSAATAQASIALLLELTHGVGNHSNAVHTGEWSRQPTFAYWRQPLVELDGKTMVIFGYGAIGSRVGAIAEALGMTVIPAAVPGRPPSDDRMPMDEALAKADVVSLHSPLTDLTENMIDARALKLMNQGAFLVNAGRGQLIDENAVRAALDSGHLGGFAADVLSQEPPPANHPLIGAPRTILTPHFGWAASAARQRAADWTGESIGAYLKGSPVRVVAQPNTQSNE